MRALPTDILTALLEALRTHRNARRAAALTGVNPATASRIAKKHGITLIPLAEHMKARRADPAFIAKQAPAARKGASRWLKAQHAKPKFHKESTEAARRNLTRLNCDPAFRRASSERLKRLHENPAFGAKLDAARRDAQHRKAQLREKAIQAALRTLARLDDDPVFRLAASARLNRPLHDGPALRTKEAAAPRAARNRGFAIAPILYLLGLIGVGAGVLFSGYSQILRSNQTMSNTLAAKNDLQGSATTLAASSWLSTDQTLLCPPLVGSNSPSTPAAKCSTSVSAITVGTAFASAVAGNLPNNYASASTTGTPVEVGVFAAGTGAKVLDPWGHYYIYCRWENAIGNANALMIITAGANGKVETKCGDTTAQGDDMFVVWTTAVTQNRAAVWQTTTAGTSVTGAQFGATGTQVNIQTNGSVSIPGTLGVTGATALGTGGLSVTGTTALAGLSASTGSFTGAVSATNGSFSGTLSATGTTTLGALSAGSSTLSSLAVTGNGTVGGTLGVTGATTLGPLTAGSSSISGLSVTGTSYLGGNVTTSTGLIQVGTSVVATGVSAPLLTVGKAVSAVYPFTVDQYGAVTGTTFTGNLVGSQSGGSVSATTLAASGATTLSSTLGVTGVTTLSAQLNGTTAIFSGNVQAASFTGTMAIGGGGVTLSGIVPISNGGTGQTSAANALSGLFSGAGTIAQMIPGADLVNNSVTTTQLSTTGVAAGTYTSVTVGLDGRVTAGSGAGGLVSSLNDGAGDSIAVGTSTGIVYTIGSSSLGNWTGGGLMVGSSKAALDTLDVYGGVGIGTSYAGTTAAPTNGLIVQGKVGIGTTSPVTTVTVGTPLQSTSDFSAYNTPQQFEINNLYTNTAAGQYSTMSIFAQAGATANGTSVDTALQVDNFVPSTETYNFGNKIGIRSEANNAGSGTAGTMYGAQFYGYYSGTSTANGVYGSSSIGENVSIGTANNAYGTLGEAMNIGTGSIGTAYGAYNLALNNTTGTVGTAYGSYNWAHNASTGAITNVYGSFNSADNADGAVTTAYGTYSYVNNNNSSNIPSTIGSAYGLYSYILNNNGGNGTIGNAYGVYVNTSNAVNTITNGYGVYITGEGSGGTWTNKPYDLYAADTTAYNYFAGNVGIGTPTPQNPLDVNGAASIGYNVAAPSNGLIVSGNVAIGTSTANGALNVNGTATATTFSGSGSGLTSIGTANLTAITGTPSSTTFLSGNGTWATLSGAGGVTGSGTANYVARWTGTSVLGTGALYDDGTNVGIGTTSPAVALQVGGAITADFTLTAGGTQAQYFSAPTNTASVNVPTIAITTQPSASSNSSSTFGGLVNDMYVPASSSVTYPQIKPVQNQTNYAGTGNVTGIRAIENLTSNNSASATVSSIFGFWNRVLNGSTGTVTTAIGGMNDVENTSTGTMTTAYGSQTKIYNSGATANMTTAYGNWTHMENRSSNAVTNMYGDYVEFGGTGTTTNAYGVYIGSMPASGTTNKWSLYSSDSTAPNYFAGNVGIGSSSPRSLLDVAGTVYATTFSGSGASLTSIGTSNLSGITGTPSSSTYLRGDGTWATAGGSGLTVASTAIASGTTTRVLYDNAGTLGEYTITGTGNVVMSTSPTLVTPALGTPASGVMTNVTGLPLTTGVTGVLPVANGGTNASSASITAFNNITGYTASGATGTTSTNLVFSTSPTLVTPALGTPASGVMTNVTGLPLTTGVTGVLPVANGGTNASSASITAFNNITGYTASGATGTTSTNLVFSTSPTLVTPALGTPASGVMTNVTGLPLTTGVTGVLPVANGGTGTGTAFTQGSVVYTGASGVHAQDNSNFFWDATNHRLGIGTVSPSYALHVSKSVTSGPVGYFASTQTAPNTGDTSDGVLSIVSTISASSATNELVQRGALIQTTNNLTGGGHIQNMRSVSINLATNASTTTDSAAAVYIEGSYSGTTTTGYGIFIASLPGTTKYGIYDGSGGTWLSSGIIETSGSNGLFLFADRNGDGKSGGIYRSGDVNYLWDSTYGNVMSYNTSGNATFAATVTAVNLVLSSDRRLKDNITPLSSGALDIVNKLQPVTYTWKKTHGADGQQMGFIAQEVEQILPHVVTAQDDKAKTKGLKYNEFIPVLVKAVQELDAKFNKFASGVTAGVVANLKDFGIWIEKGATRIASLVADQLTIGSHEHPAGMTLYDDANGEPYCVKMHAGTLTPTKGACEKSPSSALQ